MRAIVLACVLSLATMSASADHCVVWAGPHPEIVTGETPLGSFYADNDLCQPECMFSLWVYQETNGIDGLQRGDSVVNDTCHGTIPADSIVVGGTGIAF